MAKVKICKKHFFVEVTEFRHRPKLEMLGWMKDKLESRMPGEMSITSDMQMTPPLWQKMKKN